MVFLASVLLILLDFLGLCRNDVRLSSDRLVFVGP